MKATNLNEICCHVSDKGPKLKSVFLRPLSSIVAKGDELRNRRNEVKERTRKKKKKEVAALLVFITYTLFC